MSILPLNHNAQALLKSLEIDNLRLEEIFEQIIKLHQEIEASKQPPSLQHRRENEDGPAVTYGQVNNSFHNHNELVMDPDTLVINAIQRESPQVNQLKQKNSLLKQQLQEYQFALELIMSKYRKRMLHLLEISNQCHRNILTEYENRGRLVKQANIINTTDKLQQLVQTFDEKIAPQNEEILLRQQEELHRLRIEYKGLLELFNISKKFGSLMNSQKQPVTKDQEISNNPNEKLSKNKQVQTDKADKIC